MPTTSMPDNNEQYLEPRVARLETGLETLTRNVSEMAVSMRENSTNTNNKIDALVVAVTTAQAPKKTDWSVIIAALGLCLAIGAAVFVPLNNQANDNKLAIANSQAIMVKHMELSLHPVGQALVQRLEEQIIAHAASNERVMKEHVDRDEQEFNNLDKKLQLEYGLMNAKIESQILALDAKLQLEMRLTGKVVDAQFAGFTEKQELVNTRYFERIVRLEQYNAEQTSKNDDELRQWRSKANGLSAPSSVVPLIPTQLPVVPALK